jgi:hypothetical protein
MFNKFEWVFNALLFIGIAYTAYIVGWAVYLLTLGE